jgi:type I restriction enzyme R subunit
VQPEKTAFKLLDFFATCEFFEKEFNYDQVLKLPHLPGEGSGVGPPPPPPESGIYEYKGADIITTVKEATIGFEGMKIDRMFFQEFEDTVRKDGAISKAVEAGQWDHVVDYVNRTYLNKPEKFYTLEKLRKAVAVDRRLSMREILEKAFGLIPSFKSKDEILEEEFAKLVIAITIAPT